MEARYSSNKRYIVFILVLLIHVLIALILFMTFFEKKFDSLLPHHQDIDIDLKKDWAARLPAPILFYDMIDDQPSIAQNQQNEPIVARQEAKEKEEDEQEEVTIAHHEPAKEERQEQKQVPLIEKANILTEKMAINVDQEKKAPKPKQQKTRPKKPQSQTMPLSLADLTKMYKKQIEEVPIENIFLQGAPDRLPPDKQISFERYKTKINSIINDMYKIYKNEMGIVPPNLSVKVYVAMERKGSFKDLYLATSSGYPLIDKCVMKIYQEAGDRFPPIPKGLEAELFKGFIILHSGYHTSGTWLPF